MTYEVQLAEAEAERLAAFAQRTEIPEPILIRILVLQAVEALEAEKTIHWPPLLMPARSE